MEDTYTGSCCCGAIEYSFTGMPRVVVNCHCDDCKKRNGSVYSTYMAVPEKRVSFSKGEQSLKKYIIEGKGEKWFCTECGSPVFNINYRFPGMFMMFYGALDRSEEFSPVYNVFCESKHDWVDSIDKLTSFQTGIEK
jgi:hypothetical protein